MDIRHAAMAYTSASTALNQKESVNEKASEPTAALPRMAMAFVVLISSCFETMLEIKMVKDQNINRIVKALAKTDIRLIVSAIYEESKAKIEKKAPII